MALAPLVAYAVGGLRAHPAGPQVMGREVRRHTTSSENQFAIASAFASSISLSSSARGEQHRLRHSSRCVSLSPARLIRAVTVRPRVTALGWCLTGDPARLLLGRWGARGYGLINTNTPKRARLAWAIQVSFFELLSQFPSENDLLQRCFNRYDKRGVTGESLGYGRLIRIRFG